MLVGKVRAKQYYSDDADRGRNLGVLLHGDGAFAGQGVVYETLDMSALPDYTVGGCIHLIVNNQVRARAWPMLLSARECALLPFTHELTRHYPYVWLPAQRTGEQ